MCYRESATVNTHHSKLPHIVKPLLAFNFVIISNPSKIIGSASGGFGLGGGLDIDINGGKKKKKNKKKKKSGSGSDKKSGSGSGSGSGEGVLYVLFVLYVSSFINCVILNLYH